MTGERYQTRPREQLGFLETGRSMRKTLTAG